MGVYIKKVTTMMLRFMHMKATYGSHTLRAVVADTRELRTVLRSTALPVLFVREQTQTGGF